MENMIALEIFFEYFCEFFNIVIKKKADLSFMKLIMSDKNCAKSFKLSCQKWNTNSCKKNYRLYIVRHVFLDDFFACLHLVALSMALAESNKR
jgi:hypothetical protein